MNRERMTDNGERFLSGKQMAKYTALILILWCSLFFPWNAFALNSGDIVRLKRAGVSDKVIEEIIRSKAIVRALVSVDEVIEMKAAGIGDGIILAMIEGEMPQRLN